MNHLISSIERSGLRSITELAHTKYSHFDDVIYLGYGQPKDAPSERLCEAIKEAADQKLTSYTLNQGSEDFRSAVVTKIQQAGITANIDQIFAIPGATYGIAISIACLINPEDEILIPDPGYPNFSAVAKHFGADVKYYSLSSVSNFEPNIDEIKSLITEKTRAIIINSPGNPTGAVWSDSIIQAIVRVCKEHDIWIISDEVYDQLVFWGEKHSSILAYQNSYDKMVSVFSLSKTFNLCGLRIGYLVSPNSEFLQNLLKAQEFYCSCASSISQYVGKVALLEDSLYVDSLRRSFEFKMKNALEQLGDKVNYLPRGAFYILIDISNSRMGSTEFSLKLLERKHVVVAPGITFGPQSDKYIRISLVDNIHSILSGINGIIEFIDESSA
jgi:aspartate/methionine/tyrosine aminotransferase